MPGGTLLEATYYCTDEKLRRNEKEKMTQLFIQLHDCICIMKVDKSTGAKTDQLETVVHNKVIHERGYLC